MSLLTDLQAAVAVDPAFIACKHRCLDLLAEVELEHAA